MDADIARSAQKVVHDRAVQDLKPSRPCGLPNNDLGDVVCLRVADHVVSNAPSRSRDRDRLAAERLCQAQGIGNTIPILLAELQAARALDVEGDPGSVQTIGQSFAVTY